MPVLHLIGKKKREGGKNRGFIGTPNQSRKLNREKKTGGRGGGSRMKYIQKKIHPFPLVNRRERGEGEGRGKKKKKNK